MGKNVVSGETGLRQRTNDELVHLVRKYRWMGLEDQASQAEAQLARRLALFDRNPLFVASGAVANPNSACT
jgi:hypothetical protein